MTYSTYFLEKGDTVPCMRCSRTIVLDYEPVKCCMGDKECGCQGTPEPIFCEECWKELEE